jgi:hypothetical protein
LWVGGIKTDANPSGQTVGHQLLHLYPPQNISHQPEKIILVNGQKTGKNSP